MDMPVICLTFFDKKYLHEFTLFSQDGGFFVTLSWKFTQSLESNAYMTDRNKSSPVSLVIMCIVPCCFF